jgi:hypothetical protein
MTDQRYKSYVFISRVFRSELFTELERDVLTDCAEGLLLVRDTDERQIAELDEHASAALEGMRAARRIHAATAAELMERIRDCGPEPMALAA